MTSPDDESCFDEAEVVVSGTTDAEKITVQVNDNDPVEVEIVDGKFSQTFELDEGKNTITIVATSEIGMASTVTRTVTIDTLSLVFKSVIISPNPVDCGKTFVFSVKLSDDDCESLR